MKAKISLTSFLNQETGMCFTLQLGIRPAEYNHYDIFPRIIYICSAIGYGWHDGKVYVYVNRIKRWVPIDIMARINININ